MRAVAGSRDSTGGNSQPRDDAAARRRAHAKSQVMAAIGELVDDGKAEWDRTASGEIELRLLTGEVFLLGEVSVFRLV
jgi:hypothetical protein